MLNAGIGERGDYLDPAIATEALEKTLDVELWVLTQQQLSAPAAGTPQRGQQVQRGKGGRIITLASAAGAMKKVQQWVQQR